MSNSSDFEDRVRREAYRLWEEAGRPHHREAEFWHQASALVASEPPAPAKKAPAAPKVRKKAAEPAPAAPPRRKAKKAGNSSANPSA